MTRLSLGFAVLAPLAVTAFARLAGDFLGDGSEFHSLAWWLRDPIALPVWFGAIALWCATAPGGSTPNGEPRATPLAAPLLAGLAVTLSVTFLRLRQHYAFQTHAYDLGIQSSVAWNTATGRPFHDSIRDMNYLGDHFSPFYLLLAPFYRLWPDAAALLLLQSIAIGIAAALVFSISRDTPRLAFAAPLLTCVFATHPHLHRVSAFDFHPVALAVPIFLGMLLAIERRRTVPVLVLALLAATIEETLLPALFGVGLYWALVDSHRRVAGVGVAVVSGLVLVLVASAALPFFLGSDQLTHGWRYPNLGGPTFAGIVASVASDPSRLAAALLEPQEKWEAVSNLFETVAFLPLLAPLRLLLVAPPLLVNLLSSFPPQFALERQYPATILPFLFYATIGGFGRLLSWFERPGHRTLVAVGRVAVGITLAIVLRENMRLYEPYLLVWPKAQVAETHRLLESIPPTATVAASDGFVPHLTSRRRVIMFGAMFPGWTLRSIDLRGIDTLVLRRPRRPRSAGRQPASEYEQAVEHVLASGEYVPTASSRRGVSSADLLLSRRRKASEPAGASVW